jgi:hypothetical protein
MSVPSSVGSAATDSPSAVDTPASNLLHLLLWTVGLAAISWALYTLALLPQLAASTDAGYYIGIVGASLMLLLFTYPLFKRVQAFRSFGSAKFWFRLHMICGLLGPALIIVHSGLHMRSLNAAWAFWSMVVVASSGVIGRFLYRGIHRGMHGELETAQSLAAAVTLASQSVDKVVPKDAAVSREIAAYAKHCAHLATTSALGSVGALWLPLSRWMLLRHVRATLKHADFSPERSAAKRQLLGQYLVANQRYAQFALFRRLFSLWHVAHVPFVVTLVLATIAHIVAVHLY